MCMASSGQLRTRRRQQRTSCDRQARIEPAVPGHFLHSLCMPSSGSLSLFRLSVFQVAREAGSRVSEYAGMRTSASNRKALGVASYSRIAQRPCCCGAPACSFLAARTSPEHSHRDAGQQGLDLSQVPQATGTTLPSSLMVPAPLLTLWFTSATISRTPSTRPCGCCSPHRLRTSH
jgi:hypothetical protein